MNSRPSSLQCSLDADEENKDIARVSRGGSARPRVRKPMFQFRLVALVESLLLFPSPSLAANADVELRIGVETECFTCPDRTFPWTAHPTGQLFTDLLFPMPYVESLEFGPYIKLAGVEDVFQAAGGIAVGVSFSRWEALVNAGLAYSGRRISEIRAANGASHPGQSQGTYDLGLSLRFFFSETKKRWYGSFQYTHNSNGEQIGLNWLSDKNANPGIDAVTVGLGYRY